MHSAAMIVLAMVWYGRCCGKVGPRPRAAHLRRVAAASALGQVGKHAAKEKCLKALEKCLEDSVEEVRKAASSALGQLGFGVLVPLALGDFATAVAVVRLHPPLRSWVVKLPSLRYYRLSNQ